VFKTLNIIYNDNELLTPKLLSPKSISIQANELSLKNSAIDLFVTPSPRRFTCEEWQLQFKKHSALEILTAITHQS